MKNKIAYSNIKRNILCVSLVYIFIITGFLMINNNEYLDNSQNISDNDHILDDNNDRMETINPQKQIETSIYKSKNENIDELSSLKKNKIDDIPSERGTRSEVIVVEGLARYYHMPRFGDWDPLTLPQEPVQWAEVEICFRYYRDGAPTYIDYYFTYTDSFGFFQKIIAPEFPDNFLSLEISVNVMSKTTSDSSVFTLGGVTEVCNIFKPNHAEDTPYKITTGWLLWDGSQTVIVDTMLSEDENLNCAFHVHDVICDANEWVRDNTWDRWTRSRIDVFFPSGLSNSGYSGLYDEIQIIDQHGWWDDAPQHEYGHAVMAGAYDGNEPLAIGPSDHIETTESNEAFAYVEGWAEFFQCVVDNRAWDLPDRDYGWDNIERNHWEKREDSHHTTDNYDDDFDGHIVEGSVASIFWDMWDGTDAIDWYVWDPDLQMFVEGPDGIDDSGANYWYTSDRYNDDEPDIEDDVDFSFGYIFDVLRYDRPDDILDFWNDWFNRDFNDPATYFHEHWMKAIYYNHGIRRGDLHEQGPWISHDFPPSPSQNGYYKGSIRLKARAGEHDVEDQEYLRIRFQYSDDGGNSWNDITGIHTIADVFVEYWWDTTGVPDGDYLVQVIVDDDMKEDYGNAWPITIDNTAPITTPTLDGTIGDNDWYVTDVEITLTALDAISGIDNTYFRINGDTWQTYVNPFLITTDGLHNVEYYSEDRAENIEATNSIDLKIDKTLPPIPIVTWVGHVEGDSSNDRDPVFTWTVPSDLSGIAGYSYVLDTNKYTLPDDISQGIGLSAQFSVSEDGTYYFHIKAIDGAGNWGYPQNDDDWYFEIIIEMVSPETPIISSPTHLEDIWEWDNDPVFTWTEPYDLSGIAGYSYAIDSSPTFDPGTSIDTSERVTSFKDVANGIWYFHIRAIDNAGNPGSIDSYKIKIDDFKPISEAEALTTYKTSISFDIHYTTLDLGGSGVQYTELWYRVDTGGGFGIWNKYSGIYYSSPISFNAPSDGNYEFYTITTDWAGNIEDGPYWIGHETAIYDKTQAVAWGDMNNDNYIDLAIGGRDEGVHIYLNDNGDLENVPIWNTPLPSIIAVEWCDINNDGNQDLSIVGQAGGTYRVQVFININGMLESTFSSQIIDSNLITSIAWGDIDGDGDLDLVTGVDGPNKWYKNNAGVLDNTPFWTSSDSVYTSSVALGDLSNDGDLDLVAGNIGNNRIYFNILGTFISTYEIDISTYTLDITLGDVNKDGFIDLVEGNSGYNNLFLNTGIGLHFNNIPSWISEDSFITMSVSLCDINADGDIDLITGDDYTHIYLSTGNIFVTIPSWNTVDLSLRVNDIAIGDVDNDGIFFNPFIETKSGDGIKKVFYLDYYPIKSISEVIVNGIPLPLTDYCVSYESGWIAFKNAPPSGTNNIQFEYIYSYDLDIASVCENGIIDSYYSMVYKYWPRFRNVDATTIVDTIPPEAPVISSPTHPVQTSWYSNNDPLVRWIVPYDLNGIAGFSFILDTTYNTILDDILNCDGTITEHLYTDKLDKIYYFHIKARDNAGNWGGTSHFTIRIDIEAPDEPIITSIYHPEDEWTSYSYVYMEWQGPSDDLSGINGYGFVFDDNSDTIPDMVSNGNDQFYVDYYDNGVWYCHVRAEDNAGNWGATSHYTVKIDRTSPQAPTISSSSHPDENIWYNDNDPIFSWNEPSDLSGIDGYCIILSQDPNYPLGSIPDYFSTTRTEPDVLDGIWYLHVRAIDNAGNPSYIDTYTVKIDTTSPPAPIISSPTHVEDVWTSNKHPEFEWTVPDDASGIAGYSYLLDQISTTIPNTDSEGTETTERYENIADGEWWFHVRALDNSGKWGDTDHYKIKIDITDPEIIIGPEVALVTETTATIEWTTNEACSSYVEWSPGSYILDPAYVTVHSLTILDLSLDTEYHYTVISWDYAENHVISDTYSFTIKKIDTLWYPDTSDPIFEMGGNLFVFPPNGGDFIFYVKIPKTANILSTDFNLAPDHGFPDYPSYIEIDIGMDANVEWSVPGELGIGIMIHSDKYTNPVIIQAFQNYIDDPNQIPDSDGYINVPIKLSSDTEGGLWLGVNILHVYQYVWAIYEEPNPNPTNQDCISVCVEITYTGPGGIDIIFLPGSDYRIFSTIGNDDWIKPATLKQHYADINNDGLIDGTTIPESTLRMYWWDDASQSWLEAGDVFGWENTGVNTEMNYIWTNVDHFSNFTAKGSYIPISETESLIDTLNSMDIPPGIKNSLLVKLEASLDYLNIALNHYINEDFNLGNENMTLAKNSLIDFINEIRALESHLLQEEDADLLIEKAVEIIALIDEAYVE